ncbi:hypothetical protein F5884DRAFT_785948 [Xylogone sp. PMI_703]|nr:hypothetical protein F5884DRAFT_785948 [Xylogone sp. PMI_703]
MVSPSSFVCELRSDGISQQEIHQPNTTSTYLDHYKLPAATDDELCLWKDVPSKKLPVNSVSGSLSLTEGLSKVSPELIFLIAKFLPPAEIAALSLLCRGFRNLLEKGFLYPLMECWSSDEFSTFQELIAKDFPDHIACQLCHRLHHITATEALEYIPKSRDGDDAEGCMMNYINLLRRGTRANWYFSPPVFLMAMKLFRQQRDYSKYLELLSPKELRLCNPSIVEWSQSLARVCQNNFILRRQNVWTPAPTETKFDWKHQICAHIQVTRVAQGRHNSIQCCYTTVGMDTVQVYNNGRDGGKREHNRMLQCRFCHTEFHIGFTKLDNQQTSLFATAWHDLGEGKTASDTKWQRHINGNLETLQEASLSPGSISSAFEQEGSFNFSPAITSSEINDLLNIVRALELEDSEKKTDCVSKAIDEFFGHRRDWYAGPKDPQELYGDECPAYDPGYEDEWPVGSEWEDESHLNWTFIFFIAISVLVWVVGRSRRT